jgi:hypothetical protein
MAKDLDVRFPPEVRQMVLDLTDPTTPHDWRASKGWLVVRLVDDDEDEIAVCWVLGHVKVPKKQVNDAQS